MLNLDTHIVVYALTGELTGEERRLLRSDSWSVSAIVLWELAKLAQLDRIEVDMESADFTRLFSRIHVWPLDLDTCRQSVSLDFHGDPADEIIAATSITRNVPLLTRDRRILASKQVPFAGRISPPRTR
jgi:PIN domain nuclease of toxin-antitoxin system